MKWQQCFAFGRPFIWPEDDEFLHNFILNEETIAEYERLMNERPSRMSSLVSDMVLFSGSVAAVAGAVLYLSERGTRYWSVQIIEVNFYFYFRNTLKYVCNCGFFQLRQPLRLLLFCQQQWQQCLRWGSVPKYNKINSQNIFTKL